MAVSFNDWVDTDVILYQFSSTDTARVLNGDGVLVQALSIFDYFNDAPNVNDVFEFRMGRLFMDIKFFVGTAMDGAPVFVWEYKHTDGTWLTLNVLNGDCLRTGAGEEIVRFTPPLDWRGLNNDRPYHRVRCRLTDVTAVTEGGAQSTQKLQIGNLAFTVTGLAQDIGDVVADDNANFYVILDAVTPVANITPIEMPVLRLEYSDLVDVVLVGNTLGPGDTVVLTGIDIEDNAIVETIDVAGGPATYTSTHQFKNITDVACNGFNDGTIEVRTQERGFIRQLGDFVFDIAAYLFWGDDVTTTTIVSTNEMWNFRNHYDFVVTKEATLTLGQENTGGKVDGTSDWSMVHINRPGRFFNDHMLIYEGTLNLFGSTIWGSGLRMDAYVYGASTWNIRDAQIDLGDFFRFSGIAHINNLYMNTFVAERVFRAGSTVDGFNVDGTLNFLNHRISLLLENSNMEGILNCNNRDVGRSVKFLDCNITSADFAGAPANLDAGDGVYIQFHLDLKVVDGDWNAISGATVTIYDVLGNLVFNGVTDVNGDIAQQTLNLEKGTWNFPGAGITWVTHTPHTVTISNPGYPTRTMEYTMDRKREEIEKLGGAAPHGMEYRRRRVPGEVSAMAEYM